MQIKSSVLACSVHKPKADCGSISELRGKLIVDSGPAKSAAVTLEADCCKVNTDDEAAFSRHSSRKGMAYRFLAFSVRVPTMFLKNTSNNTTNNKMKFLCLIISFI